MPLNLQNRNLYVLVALFTLFQKKPKADHPFLRFQPLVLTCYYNEIIAISADHQVNHLLKIPYHSNVTLGLKVISNTRFQI